MALIDIDNVSTWPSDLRKAVEHAAQNLRCRPTACSDVLLEPAAAEPIRSFLAHVRVRAFHASRLLPHEIEAIRHGGLALADQRLFERKLAEASARGFLTELEVAQILSTMRPLDGSDGTRAGQTCVGAGTYNFRADLDAVSPLLESWGGEVLYSALDADSLGARLRELGTPTIVEVTIPARRKPDKWFPPAESCLIGAVLGLDAPYADVHVRAATIPSGDVLAVHSPDTPWWRQYPGLPT